MRGRLKNSELTTLSCLRSINVVESSLRGAGRLRPSKFAQILHDPQFYELRTFAAAACRKSAPRQHGVGSALICSRNLAVGDDDRDRDHFCDPQLFWCLATVFQRMWRNRRTVLSGQRLHLRAIQAAFLQYANDNGNCYPPTRDISKRSWEMTLSPYIGPLGAFACPSDSEIFPHEGSSYDWRDTYDPATTLAGKPVGGSIRPNSVLAFETLPGWHAKNKINAVMNNGSCQPMDADACLNDLLKPIAIARPQSP